MVVIHLFLFDILIKIFLKSLRNSINFTELIVVLFKFKKPQQSDEIRDINEIDFLKKIIFYFSFVSLLTP